MTLGRARYRRVPPLRPPPPIAQDALGGGGRIDRIVAGRFAEGAAYTNWRAHGTQDWLLIHTEAGHGRFGLPDPDRVDVITEPGDVVLIRPGVPHDYGTAGGPGWSEPSWVLLFCHVHPRTDWLPLLDWPELAPGIGRLRLTGETRRRVESALHQTVTLCRSGLTRAELFGMNALESALLWASTQLPGQGRLDPRLITALELIGSRLAEPWDADRLAATIGMSGSRLAHLFTEQLGVPPREFIERQRMQAAEQLLELSTRSVTEVAAAVGYDDPLYFSTRFRRFSGSSPSLFRRRRRPRR